MCSGGSGHGVGCMGSRWSQQGSLSVLRSVVKRCEWSTINRSAGRSELFSNAHMRALGIHAAARKIAQQSTGEREAGRRSSVVQRAVGGRQREGQADSGGVKRYAVVFCLSFLWVGA